MGLRWLKKQLATDDQKRMARSKEEKWGECRVVVLMYVAVVLGFVLLMMDGCIV